MGAVQQVLLMSSPGGFVQGNARYWRYKTFVVAGGFLELTELQPHVGAASVVGAQETPSAFTSSDAPTGALSNLIDGSLSTRCYWADTVAEAGGFYIRADMGTAKKINRLRLGGFDTADRYPSALTLQYSDDDAAWTTQASVTGLTYPGNNTLSDFINVSGAGATAHRYWRINGISVAGTFLEISEIEFWSGDYFYTITAQTNPSPGNLKTLCDTLVSAGSKMQWTDTVAESSAFWIQFDFGVGVSVSIDGLKLAGDANAANYPSSLAVEWSTDGAVWSANGSASSLAWPGANTLSALITPV